MNKRKIAGVILLGIVLSVMMFLGMTLAADAKSQQVAGGSVVVSKADTIDHSIYVAGDSLRIDGTVKGDVYCASQTVNISGTVEGDVICATQNLKMSGTINGDVRVAAQNVSYGGETFGSVTLFAQSIDMEKDASIGRDFNGAAQVVVIDGEIKRDVALATESLTVNGIVGRNIDGHYEQVTITNDATVDGSLRYVSDEEAVVANGVIKGETIRSEPVSDGRQDDAGEWIVGAAFYTFFAALLIAMVLALLFPGLLKSITDNGVRRLLLSLLTGFFVAFGGPLLLGLVAATLIGIPLAIVLFLVWLVVIILSGPVFGFYLGRVLMQGQTSNTLLIMLVGAGLLVLLYFVPIMNLFALLAAGTIGSGMIVLEVARRFKRPKYDVAK